MKSLKTELVSFAGLLIFFGGILIGCATSEPFTPGYVPQLSPVKEYDQTKEMSFTGQIIEVINDTTPPTDSNGGR
jgi:hypothetical protein